MCPPFPAPRPHTPPALSLPSADGVQPDQPCQWWYWSGQLRGENGRRYGFQLAVFAAEAVRGLLWGQMAHWALIDLESGTFVNDSRIWLGAPKRVEGRFQLATRDGRARAHGGDGRDRLRLQLPGFALDLRASGGPLVQHYEGREHSYSFGGRSYYYSRPRMRGEGVLQTPRGPTKVHGEVWFDRQFGELSSALAEGWQWLSIHLDNDEQLMVFGFNRSEAERFASVTNAKGETRWLGPDAFELQATEHWQSPASGVAYASAWRLRTDQHTLEIRAASPDQEMQAPRWRGPIYWEGACEVSGSHSGRAYAELLGSLAEPLAGWLRGERGPERLRAPIRQLLLHPPVVLGIATAVGWGARRVEGLRPRFDVPQVAATRAEVTPLHRDSAPARPWRKAAGQ